MAFQSMDYERLKRKSSENNKEREREFRRTHFSYKNILWRFCSSTMSEEKKKSGLVKVFRSILSFNFLK